MASADCERELALRAHVRNLLLDYALTHLTTNYVTWTQDAVTELLAEDLTYVLPSDPTDPLLPADVHDLMIKRLLIHAPKNHDESWRADAQAVRHLRTYSQVSGRRPTLQCWEHDIDGDCQKWLLQRPMSPILTARAMRETPKPGSGSAIKHLPRCGKALLRYSCIDLVHTEDQLDQPQVQQERALALRLPMTREMHGSMVKLFKTVPALSALPTTPNPQTCSTDFLRAESPPCDVIQLASPPLFPRERRPRRKASDLAATSTSGLSTMADLASMISPVDIKEEDVEDLYQKHMVIVDGWQAYETPSSSIDAYTPSLADDSSEVDELFLASPLGSHEPLIQTLVSAQIDEYELPRTARFRHSESNPKLIGEDKSLASFLTAYIDPFEAQNLTTPPRSRPSSPLTTITMSLLGQPPSAGASAVNMRNQDYSDSPGLDLDNLVEKIYGERKDRYSFDEPILRERLDEKDSLLMDVPVMRAPNDHPTDMFLPCRPADLLVPPEHIATNSDINDPSGKISASRQFGYLKKVKGLQSLNIELTWIPFKYGSTIPTNEEVADVCDDIQESLINDLGLGDESLSELSALLSETHQFEPDDPGDINVPPSIRSCWDEEAIPQDRVKSSPNNDPADVIFTRFERNRMQDLEDGEGGSSDAEDEQHRGLGVRVSGEPSERPAKRVKICSGEDLHDGQDDDDLQQTFSNDSGVFITASGLNEYFRSSNFTGMAYYAEVFDGSYVDGDLFPDVDPIHDLGLDRSPLTSHVFDNTITNDAEHWLSFENVQNPLAPCSGHSFEHEHVPDYTDHFLSEDEVLEDHEVVDNSHLDDTSVPLGGPYAAVSGSLVSGSSRRVLIGHGATPSVPVSVIPAPSRMDVTMSDALWNVPPISSVKQSLSTFLELVARQSTDISRNEAAHRLLNSNEVIPEVALNLDAHPEGSRPSLASVPAELVDQHTLCLLDSMAPPSTSHRYMASIDLIQKRALVQCLRSGDCAVDLAERDYLNNVQLILDPETAVLFASLAAVQSQLAALTVSLSHLSWRFSHLLVVFEGFPVYQSYKKESSPRPIPNVFSPPVIKAVKKLRRDLSIAEGCETKRAGTLIQFAFATSVNEAAMLIRRFGDLAEVNDRTGGALWGEREWLELEEQDGESDLSCVPGMNAFAASVILSQVTLDDFLADTPDERLRVFGPLVGEERIMCFNKELARRTMAVEPASSPE